MIGGSFLTPFGTFNERLSPFWINNLQDGPLIGGLGLMNTGTSLGGQLRGSAISRRKYSIDYAAYFSAESANEYFNAARSSGGRVNLYLPEQRLEIGTSYGRLLQGTHENFYGIHVWWEPKDTGFRLRSEWAKGAHGQGYWVEADWRMMQFGGYNSWVGRFEPVFRMQQTFTENGGGDPLPAHEYAARGLRGRLQPAAQYKNSDELLASVFLCQRREYLGDGRYVPVPLPCLERTLR